MDTSTNTKANAKSMEHTIASPQAPRRMSANEAPGLGQWSMWLALILCLIYPLRVFIAGGQVHSKVLARDLTGQVFLITGANTGIGFETAQQLAKQHAHVVMACRNITKCNDAAADIRTRVREATHRDATVDTMHIDTSSLASVRKSAKEFLEKYDRLDVLIANAGIMMSPYQLTREGNELQMATNVYGHFLLTELLLPLLNASAPSRVVIVASRAHGMGGDLDPNKLNAPNHKNDTMALYGRSKLANILHARALAKRMKHTGITVVSLHPGMILTELFRYVPFASVLEVIKPVAQFFFKSTWEGAQTTLYAALHPDVPANTGAYFADCQVTTPEIPQASDDALADRVYAAIAKIVRLR